MNRSRFNAGIFAVVSATTASAVTLFTPAANAQTLYNGSLGTTPSAQGWLTLGSVPTTSDSYNAAGGYTTLNTSSSSATYAGYSNYSLAGTPVNTAFPVLNAATGFTLDFTAQVSSELSTPTSTSANPRAGLSVILLDSQHEGIEIGIDTNSVFSQSSDFTSASEFQSTTLTGALTTYALTVTGTTYTLTGFNMYVGLTQLLTGSIKQYTGTGFPASVVYNESNFLFIGDDTTANGGSFNFRSASINAGSAAAAPEPGGLALMGAGVITLATVGLRRRRRAA